jgi:hypothetical protein
MSEKIHCSGNYFEFFSRLNLPAHGFMSYTCEENGPALYFYPKCDPVDEKHGVAIHHFSTLSVDQVEGNYFVVLLMLFYSLLSFDTKIQSNNMFR